MAISKRRIRVGILLAIAVAAAGFGCETPAVERTISRSATGGKANVLPVNEAGRPSLPHDGATPEPVPVISPVARPSTVPPSPATSAPSGTPASPASIPPDHVGTIAGSGEFGNQDGPALAATFQRPWGVVLDAEGQIIVSDDGANSLRRLGPDGRLVTFATGFRQPRGLALEPGGTFLVADYANHRVKRVSAKGGVETVVGASDTGRQDGPVESARLFHPAAVAQVTGASPKPAREIFIADSHNCLIRRLGPAPSASPAVKSGDVVSTLESATGVETLAGPFGVAVAANGYIYVADTDHHRIVRFEPLEDEYVLRKIAGTGTRGFKDGFGSTAQFSSPMGLAFDRQGNLYVADAFNHAIRKLDAPDKVGRTSVTTVAGTGFRGFEDGPRLTARFAAPTAVAFDAEGNLIVADSDNSRLRKIRFPAQDM